MIYIVYYDLYSTAFGNGIRRKILGQIQAFRRVFGKVYHTCYMGQTMYLLDEDTQIEKEFAITKKDCNEIICAWIDKYKVKRTYIRYAFADKWFMQLLEYQKGQGIKTVIEIPTYPYDGEGICGRVKIEDAYYRMEIYKYANLIATNSKESDVWGIKCNLLLNGIDINDYALCKKAKKEERIVFIAVSSLTFWQGYERMIQGIYNYYKEDGTYDLHFKIVGEGPEKRYYHSLVKKYDLHSHIEFCGELDGRDLERQYEQADLAVSSLGRYKSGIYDITPIKGAEYCARGIPFICGYHDMRFTENEKFIMNVSNDSQPIDMDRVLEFYRQISEHTEYQKEMHEYAIKYLTWDVVLKPFIEYLK